MIKAAKNSGADYAKFQNLRRVKNLKSGPWDNDGRRQIYEKLPNYQKKIIQKFIKTKI